MHYEIKQIKDDELRHFQDEIIEVLKTEITTYFNVFGKEEQFYIITCLVRVSD